MEGRQKLVHDQMIKGRMLRLRQGGIAELNRHPQATAELVDDLRAHLRTVVLHHRLSCCGGPSPAIKFVEQDEYDAQVDPCGVGADVTVTVVQVLEIRVIVVGIVGIWYVRGSSRRIWTIY
jgi:hypothetical protein